LEDAGGVDVSFDGGDRCGGVDFGPIFESPKSSDTDKGISTIASVALREAIENESNSEDGIYQLNRNATSLQHSSEIHGQANHMGDESKKRRTKKDREVKEVTADAVYLSKRNTIEKLKSKNTTDEPGSKC
jgi:hypothetical protein